MRQARCLKIGILPVVIHLEDAAGHLMNAVVDGLVGVEDSLQEGVLD